MTREWLELLCLANTILLLGAVIRLMTHVWSLRRAESRLYREKSAHQPAPTLNAASSFLIENEIEAQLWKEALEQEPQIAEALQSACVTSLNDLLKLSDRAIQDICAEAGLDTVLTALMTLDAATQQTLLRALSRTQRQEIEKTLQRREKWNDFTRQQRTPTPETTERARQTVMALAQKRI